MRFSFTDDQLAFRDAVRDLLAKECPPERVRAAWTSDDGRSGAWPALAEMGVVGITAPEAAGGLGLDDLDLVLLLEETGRAALPEPIVEHSAVALPFVAEQLPGAATGDVLLSAAPGTGLVPYAADTDALLLERDGRLHLVRTADATLTPRPSVDGAHRVYDVEWRATAATTVGDPADAALAFDRGALGTAAQLVGVAQHLLDTTVEYAGQREQFGVPIGSFQAVKHHLANVALALEFARPLVYRAAYSVARGDPDRAVHVSTAKAHASDAAALAARVGLQVHGAIGYTTEYDLHLWMKRAWALAGAWGDAAWHRARVGRAILDVHTEEQ
jgi:alkylation response protein AidB-like acyl-CoA dehydrogenase